MAKCLVPLACQLPSCIVGTRNLFSRSHQRPHGLAEHVTKGPAVAAGRMKSTQCRSALDVPAALLCKAFGKVEKNSILETHILV